MENLIELAVKIKNEAEKLPLGSKKWHEFGNIKVWKSWSGNIIYLKISYKSRHVEFDFLDSTILLPFAFDADFTDRIIKAGMESLPLLSKDTEVQAKIKSLEAEIETLRKTIEL